jgi:cobalt-zinc-cadmium efflux system outer membrane protein
MKQKAKSLTSMLLCMGVLSLAAKAQDTLRLTLPQAEALFLKNNLSLVAAQYNIKAQEAMIRQAKAWDNPVLNTDQNFYDGKFFRHGKETPEIPQSGGQVYLSLQQVIRTANKRGLQMQMAQDATKSSEAQFAELMRNLRYVLTTDLNNLSQWQSTTRIYETEIVHMQQLVRGMDEMYKVGDISQKDNVRIKALLYSLQSDYADNLRQQQDLQKDIRTMLQVTDNVFITVQTSLPGEQTIRSVALAPLLDSVNRLRPDVALVNTQVAYQQHNLGYQKALAVPDVTAGLEYDRANSYVPNYYGLLVSLPIPIWNKNRGNITAAQWNIKQAQTVLQQTRTAAQNEVIAAYNKLMTLVNVQKSAGGEWQNSYDQLLLNMIESYRQRKVSLIDFIDFFDSYKDTKTKQLQQQTALLNAIAELNYVTAQNVIATQ